MAAKLFNELNHKLFYLEYESERAGDFTPLQKLPANKAVVLGIVTTKNAELEDVDILKGTVRDAADNIAKGQGISSDEALKKCLAMSPQCGFASIAEGAGTGMHEEAQWKKLELLKRVAAEIWPQ